ncbi:SRPBCC domain-containing protein [Methylocystis rosea]|uniref:SRPBCC domain-containing protein n=1 Tax=Methylocystis rosea TaxID=173366 RepID=A0A3G8M6J3_9HYPH|nr:SRPBCC domain-containing protein [Methylocystis rosea]AZG77367.1 SRPBCC domain-containing protein [Methylocystis rosea]
MARRQIETEIEIEAPASRIWAHLTDFSRMPQWNPFITSISGTLSPGARLSIELSPPGKRPMHFTPDILAVRRNRELRWQGHLFIGGIFDGEHYFLLESLSESRTRFVQGETFSGLLVGPLSGMLHATQTGFEAMNLALKQVAERRIP